MIPKTRLYLDPCLIKNTIYLKKEDPLHKLNNVLRLKEKEQIRIFDGKGSEWEYEINKINRKELTLIQKKETRNEKKEKTVLALGFPLLKEKKIDFILQKATELGISIFMPFFSQRTIKLKVNEAKIKRWKKIITEACRQSERLWLPEIEAPLTLNQLAAKDFSLKLAGLAGKKEIEKINRRALKKIICLVGPEGGFTSAEIKTLSQNNFNFISLSPNILRSETAAIFAAGLIKYLT